MDASTKGGAPYIAVDDFIQNIQGQIDVLKSAHSSDTNAGNPGVTYQHMAMSLNDQLQFWIEAWGRKGNDAADIVPKQIILEGLQKQLDFWMKKREEEVPCRQITELQTEQLQQDLEVTEITKNIEAMWSEVENSSDAQPMNLKPTKNRRGWKNIRVFVSSTFKDFFQEREVLVKEVFPDLRLWCEERKLRLVECDLRWGIPKDTSSEDTIKICLSELDRCREENVEPYFINFIGGRTGWIPQVGDISDHVAQMYNWIYGLSMTEMEIVNGAYRRLNPNALFMLREIDELGDAPDELLKDYFESSELNKEKLKKLRSNVKERFPENNYVYHVKGKYEDEKLKLDGISGTGSIFYQKVIQFFKDRIAHQYPLDSNPENPLEVQRAAHEAFMDSRSQHVYGRDRQISKIEDYYTYDTTRSPLVVVGQSGAGKSSLMARCARKALFDTEGEILEVPEGQKNWKVFCHFVGATPRSTDLVSFLQRLAKELDPNSMEVQSKLEELVQHVYNLLSNEATRPAIIFVDAINQFDEDKQEFLGRWLPDLLSPNVRVIVSMIEGTSAHQTLRAYKPSIDEVVCGALDRKSKKEIVLNMLKIFNKRMDSDQMARLISKDGSNNPLWLTLACEEVRVQAVFENLTTKIDNLPNGLIEIEMEVFSRFESESGGKMMKATLCLLEVSRHGLLETELLQLLADPSNLEVPPFDETCETPSIEEATATTATDDGYVKVVPARDWAIVHRNLKPMLRPCGELGEGRLDFYHQSLSKAVRKMFFSGSDDEVTHVYNFWHGVLAKHFENVTDMDRKAEELPCHLEHLQQKDRLIKCLLSWPVFERLYKSDFSSDLLAYWQKCGDYALTARMYMDGLRALQESGDLPVAELCELKKKVAKFLGQAGQHEQSYQLLDECINVQINELEAPADVLGELYAFMAHAKDEFLGYNEYRLGATEQLSGRKEHIKLLEKSNEYYSQLQGDEYELRIARNKSTLINARVWAAAYEGKWDTAEHIETTTRIANETIEALLRLGDLGTAAQAYAFRSYVRPTRPGPYWEAQRADLVQAEELCLKVHGKYHDTYNGICENFGDLYSTKKLYDEAYDYYSMAVEIGMKMFGPNHPVTAKRMRRMDLPVFHEIRKQRERSVPGNA